MQYIALLLCFVLQEPDGTPFESKDFGIRLRIPSKWTVDATRQGGVILKVQMKGKGPVPSDLQVSELRMAEPITIGQYHEQLRLFVMTRYKDARIVDDRLATLGGLPGFIFEIQSKDANNVDVVSIKGIWHQSPQRFFGIDGAAATEDAAMLRTAYDQLVKSVELMPRAAQALDGPAKKWSEFKNPVKVDVKDELEIVLNDKPIGTYTLETRDAVRDGAAGYEFTHKHQADFGDDGREEFSLKGFVSADLSVQTIERSYYRLTKDKRNVFCWALGELKGGEAKIKRRINGELSEVTLKVPAGTLLSDAIEGAQYHLMELGKGLSAFPALNVFDSETMPVNVDALGVQKTKVGDQIQDIWVISVAKEDRVLTYWYDGSRRLIRITGLAPSIVVRRKP